MAINRIVKYGIEKHFKRNEIICMQGDFGQSMYVVLKGKFIVYVNSMTDFPIKVAEILPGQFFGEMSLLDGQPRSATVIAVEDSSVSAIISKEDFLRLINEDNELAFQIMKTLSSRIRSLNEIVENKSRALEDISIVKDLLHSSNNS